MKVKLDENLGNSGIAVVRLPKNSTPEILYAMVDLLANRMKDLSIVGKLWIVQQNGIREYQEEL